MSSIVVTKYTKENSRFDKVHLIEYDALYGERSHSGLVRLRAKELGVYSLSRVRIPPSPKLSRAKLRRGVECLSTLREGFEKRSDVSRSSAKPRARVVRQMATAIFERLTESPSLRQSIRSSNGRFGKIEMSHYQQLTKK